MRNIIVGSRKSPLALAQTQLIIDALPPVFSYEIKTISTEGDRRQDLHYKNSTESLKGFFTKEIERALLQGEIDLAVHSYKDMPFAMPRGLTLAACSPRENCAEAFISRSGLHFDKLPAGAVIGTSSQRRECQLLRLRPDITIKPIRGNVDTRISKMQAGEYDALVLAAAGLHRLHKKEWITHYFSLGEIIPAPAQGILALQCRSDDAPLIEACGFANSPLSSYASSIERGLAARYGGGCTSPLAANLCCEGQNIRVRLMVEIKGQLKFIDEALPKMPPRLVIDKLAAQLEELW